MLQNLGTITGLTNSGGREGEQVFGVVLNGEIARRLHELGQRGAALIRNITRRRQILHQLQRNLMRSVRFGAGARVPVNKQQMNGVRPHVKNPKAHGALLSPGRCRDNIQLR